MCFHIDIWHERIPGEYVDDPELDIELEEMPLVPESHFEDMLLVSAEDNPICLWQEIDGREDTYTFESCMSCEDYFIYILLHALVEMDHTTCDLDYCPIHAQHICFNWDFIYPEWFFEDYFSG